MIFATGGCGENPIVPDSVDVAIARFVESVRIWNGNALETINEYSLGQGTFGEGDVITLRQVRNLGPNGWYFDVYYEE